MVVHQHGSTDPVRAVDEALGPRMNAHLVWNESAMRLREKMQQEFGQLREMAAVRQREQGVLGGRETFRTARQNHEPKICRP